MLLWGEEKESYDNEETKRVNEAENIATWRGDGPLGVLLAVINYIKTPQHKFAIDMLSIPGSSCECERLFSELGDLLEPRRHSISPQLLAAIQCDRRWIRAGFGSGEVPVKEAISDEEMDAKYGVHKWDIS
ncbi:Dimer-Tnp-hAT domain containing protein [Pyrenophora tritici-repentis]|nr:Dimer-Tnp-hAT domain containing protein [Pyrenophora tritici-repentis]